MRSINNTKERPARLFVCTIGEDTSFSLPGPTADFLRSVELLNDRARQSRESWLISAVQMLYIRAVENRCAQMLRHNIKVSVNEPWLTFERSDVSGR